MYKKLQVYFMFAYGKDCHMAIFPINCTYNITTVCAV